MTITVADVKNLHMLNEAIVHSGACSMNNRQVEWISVIETPVEQFVRRNEFILTTAVGCGHDEQLLMTFIQDIIDSGAAAVAIASGKFVKTIPASIIEKAKEQNFILIELNWQIHFSDVVRAVLEQLQAMKRVQMDKIEQIRKSLLEFILAGDSLETICQFISKTLKAPVLITDRRGVVCGKSTNVTDIFEAEWSAHFQRQLEKDGLQHSTEQRFDWIHLEDHDSLQVLIKSAEAIQGYLMIGRFKNKLWIEREDPELLHLLEHVTTAVALFFLHEQVAQETEWRLRDDFVWGLALGDSHSWETMYSRGKSLGYQISLPYVSIVGLPENLTNLRDRQFDHIVSVDRWLHEQIRCLEAEAEDAAKGLALKAMVTYQQEKLIIYLEVLHDQAAETAFSFISSLEKRLSLLYPNLLLTWGISKHFGYHVFQESYLEAKRALLIGRKRNGMGSQNLFADTKMDRILESLLDNNELKELADILLASLLHYSRERKIDLLKTFTAYHRNRQNVSQTARELNLHRQSLLYRLRKIEALTGYCLDNPDDVFLLDLCIRLWSFGMMKDPSTP